MISSWRLEALENRQMLSVAAPVMAEVQPLVQPAITAKATQPKLVANSYFLSSPTLGGISGKLALKIKTVTGTAVTGTLYSTDYGGFNVAVTGTINSVGAISLTGKNSTCEITAFKGTVSSTSNVISGSCTLAQMGVTLTGKMTETRTSTAPVLKTPTYTSLIGRYSGTSSATGDVTISITKQTGGLFWGTSIMGFESASGAIHLRSADPDGYSIVTLTRHNNGSMTGSFVHYNPNGSKGTGTVVLNKV